MRGERVQKKREEKERERERRKKCKRRKIEEKNTTRKFLESLSIRLLFAPLLR